jgi:hypothetical protein
MKSSKPKPEMVLYKPNRERLAHIFKDGFGSNVGETLCGRKIFSPGPVVIRVYKATECCPRCEEALRIMEAHKADPV